MGSVFLFHEGFIFNHLLSRPRFKIGDPAVEWQDKPTSGGVILYLITPVICLFGICGNTLSLMVLKRRELVGSVYTYLAVMAAANLAMSIILFLGGLSRGAFYFQGWVTYDALISLPLSGTVNLVSVMAIVGVTVDRVIFLWNPVQCTSPRFCNPKIARRIMSVTFVLALLLNLPYCFIFDWSPDGGLKPTPFFDTRFYADFNWFMLIAFSIVPAVILIFGNSFLIRSLRRARKMSIKLYGNKRKDNTSLTIILITIIILFLVSELPSSLVSRTKAVTLLFRGQHDMENSKPLETIREICTVIGALNITGNFIFYYLFSPSFCRAMQKTIKRKGKKQRRLKVNLFVVGSSTGSEGCNMFNVPLKKRATSLQHYENIAPEKCNCSASGTTKQYIEKGCYVYAEYEKSSSNENNELSSSYENVSTVCANEKF